MPLRVLPRPLASLVSLAAALPTAALAEDQLPTVTVQAAAIRPGSLQDEVTTGSKTGTALRDLPATVSVVPQEVLRAQAVTDMNRAMDNASGVQPLMGGGYGFANNYVARGLAVRFLRDGYPDGTTQNGYWRTMADVERIEVLKGPGSALYGAGQPGGTINVITRQPQQKPALELSAQAGSFDTRGATVDATGALAEGVSGRAILNYETTDGFRGLEREIVEVLPSLTLSLGANRRLLIDVDHRELDIKPDNYGLVFGFDRRIADVPVETRYYSPFNFSNQDIDRITLAHDWRLQETLEMRTALIHDRRELDMLRNAGGNGGNASNAMTGRNARTQHDDALYLTLQNEFIWRPAAGGHTVLAGVEGSTMDLETVRRGYNLPNIANIYAPVVPERSLTSPGVTRAPGQDFDRDITATTLSLYLQDQLALGEQWKLRAGLRADQQSFDDAGTQGLIPSTTTPRYRRIEETHVLPSAALGAVWQPAPAFSFYAGASSGRFINIATEAGAVSRKPESSAQLELGSRASWLQGRLDSNLALFETRRDNYYVQLAPAPADPVPEGADRTRGVELELSAQPLAGFDLSGAFVVQEAETTANALASNSVQGVSNRSIRGNRPVGVAKTGARVWGRYTLPQGLGVGAGLTYKGDSYADALNLYRVPAYTVYDAALFYDARAWELALNLKNLSDKRYFTNPTFAGALPGEARNVLLTLRVRFD